MREWLGAVFCTCGAGTAGWRVASTRPVRGVCHGEHVAPDDLAAIGPTGVTRGAAAVRARRAAPVVVRQVGFLDFQ